MGTDRPMANDIKNLYEFGAFRLDCAQRLLILDQEPVHLAPKAFELLAYFVEHPNQVLEKETLLSEVWNDSFVEEANLAVHISNLRKVFARDPKNSAKIETFPKVGYRLAADVKRTNNNEDSFHSSKLTGSGIRRSSFAAVLLLLTVCSAVVLYYYYQTPAIGSAQPITSIAVLPFVNEIGDPEFEYLTDGMTEILIRNLSQIPGLSVKARASVFFYKGKTIDPRSVGKEISAQAILIGRVKKNSDQFAVFFELIDSRSGNVITADNFECTREELMKVHDEISQRVSKKILTTVPITEIGGDLTQYTANREAYELYLRGRYHAARRTIPEMRTSLSYFQKAIDLAPTFALAHSGFSDSQMLLADWGAVSRAEAMPRAKIAALKAVELAPDLAEAHTSLAEVLTDPIEKEREFRRAVELNPSYAQSHQLLAELLASTGRFEEARTSIHRAIELDPLSRICRNIDGRISLFARNYDEAIAIFRRNIELDPTWGGDHDLLFHALEAKRMYPEAVDAYLTALTLFNAATESEIQLMREGFDKRGIEGFLRQRLKHLEERSRREYVRPFQIAEFHSRLNQKDKAFFLLNEALLKTPSFSPVGWLKYLPSFDNIRSDPRYDELLLSKGISR